MQRLRIYKKISPGSNSALRPMPTGAVRRNMQRKMERLQAQIEQQSNPKRMTLRQKIAAGLERLLGFKAKVTKEGKDQLAKGKIVEPTTQQGFTWHVVWEPTC